MKRKVFFIIFGFAYLYFLVMFWWLRHVSVYAPIFLSLPLALFRTIAIYIPFLSSPLLRYRKLPFWVIGGMLIERLIIDSIYPQPYLSANQIFTISPEFFSPALSLVTIYQDILLFLISFFFYSIIRMFLFKRALLSLEKVNIFFVLLICGLCVINFFSNRKAKNFHRPVKQLRIAILQPNIAQEIKNEYRNLSNFIVDKIHYQISEVEKRKEKIDIIIGPETIFPFVVKYKNKAYKYLKVLRRKLRSDLLIGGFWEDTKGNIFNSAFLITKTTIQVYKKVRLVVFGEYLPLGNIEFVRKIYNIFLPTQHFEELKSAKKFRRFNYKGLKIQVLICFEGFLEESYKNTNVDLFINLSNEGWYKDGHELYWAWNITKAFSVFSQTPIIRSTNTGISGIHYPNNYSKLLHKEGKLINFEGVYIDKVVLGEKSPGSLHSLCYSLILVYILIFLIVAILYGVILLIIIIVIIIFRLLGRFRF